MGHLGNLKYIDYRCQYQRKKFRSDDELRRPCIGPFVRVILATPPLLVPLLTHCRGVGFQSVALTKESTRPPKDCQLAAVS